MLHLRSGPAPKEKLYIPETIGSLFIRIVKELKTQDHNPNSYLNNPKSDCYNPNYDINNPFSRINNQNSRINNASNTQYTRKFEGML
jgi:hypothetical protein